MPDIPGGCAPWRWPLLLGLVFPGLGFGEAAGPCVAAARSAATTRSFRFHKTQDLCLR
jgi:hypothetical protein